MGLLFHLIFKSTPKNVKCQHGRSECIFGILDGSAPEELGPRLFNGSYRRNELA